MMRDMRYTLATLALLSLAACGGEQAGADPVTSPTTAATTTQQWASIVAGADLQAHIDDALESCGPGMTRYEDPTCSAFLMAVNYASVALVTDLDELAKEGAPPAELVDLVAETRQAAAALNGIRASKTPAGEAYRDLLSFPGKEWQPYM